MWEFENDQEKFQRWCRNGWRFKPEEPMRWPWGTGLAVVLALAIMLWSY